MGRHAVAADACRSVVGGFSPHGVRGHIAWRRMLVGAWLEGFPRTACGATLRGGGCLSERGWRVFPARRAGPHYSVKVTQAGDDDGSQAEQRECVERVESHAAH